MIVAIDMFGGATLRDPNNYRELKAVSQLPAAPDSPESLDLSEVATRWDADHIWIRVGWLRSASSVDAHPDRMRSFESMIDFARGKGWVDAAPDAVRAHWEWNAY